MSISSCTKASNTTSDDYHQQRLADGVACLEAALSYRKRGLSVLALCDPDHYGMGGGHGKKCDSPGKRPWHIWKPFQETLPTEEQIKQWWKERPTSNVGVALGPVSEKIRLDVDGPAGEARLQELSKGNLPPTWEFVGDTSKGGRGLLYGIPPGVKLRTTNELPKKGEELRFQSKGAQTVLPPSRHPKGMLYAWKPGHAPDEIELAMAPPWLIAQLRVDNHKHNGKPHAKPIGDTIAEGSRNSALTRLAGTMRRPGMGQEAIEAALLVENQDRCDPPLDEQEVKGIAASVAKYQPTADVATAEINESADDPHRLGKLFLADYRHDQFSTLRYWRDEWLLWDGACWKNLATKDVKARLCGKIKSEFDRINEAAIRLWEENQHCDAKGKPCDKPTARKVTVRLITDTVQALASLALLPWTTETPSWLKGAHPDLIGLDPTDLVICSNGIGHLPTMATEGCLNKHTPAFFSRNALTYAFSDAAPPPEKWLAYLHSLWPQDTEAIATSQEWAGYFLTSDTRQQKILMLVGPKRSGKGTFARVMRDLVGVANCCAPTLAGLATNFGLWPLIDKTLAVISDARLSGRMDQAIVTERLLSISGEDALTIDRKHLAPVTQKLPTRFMILTNELPRLHDASGALAGRMIVLKLTRSFYGHEDHHLTDKLLTELPSILLWAIEGWQRLRQRGHFVQPESGRQLIEAMEDLASPVGEFVREECEVGTGFEILCRDLYQAWKVWSDAKGRRDAGSEQVFGRDLRAFMPQLTVRQSRGGDKRVRVYQGIHLARS